MICQLIILRSDRIPSRCPEQKVRDKEPAVCHDLHTSIDNILPFNLGVWFFFPILLFAFTCTKPRSSNPNSNDLQCIRRPSVN
ncbi:hypothetical protein BDV12DRAFT_139650 [Aspergillus spectabilis]